MRIALLITGLLFLAGANLHAAESREDPARIARVVQSFLDRETKGLPGRVTTEVAAIDARVSLHPCANMQTFFPSGSAAWGQSSVGVRCAAAPAWTIYVPVNVKVYAAYLEAARPLAAGQEITAGDFSVREGELTLLPAGVLTDAKQAIGRRMARALQAGQPLRRDAVSEPPAVLQGQLVALVLHGSGFKVSSEGHALGKALEGERVQVKTASGTVVSGIVRAGAIVEVMR